MDHEKFPYKKHNGEKKVYVYLPDGEHDIEIKAPENLLISKGEEVIDYQNKLIFGISAGQTEIDGLFEPAQGYSMSVKKSSAFCGTGTVVEILLDGEAVESYSVVIIGDVNGDGIYDGMDAVIVNCLANGMLTREQVGEAVYMAADCNHDGVIDSFDVDILQQAGVLLAGVDQSKTQEELQTDSTYVQYLNLIDQNPVDEETEPE